VLEQNFPNPFTTISHIPFTLNERGRVHMGVFSMDGKNIVNIINRKMDAGSYQAELKSDLLAPGSYVVVLEVSGVKKQIRVIVQ